MQRFQVPYNLKEIPEVQSYLTAQFDDSKNAGDLQDLYRRRYVNFTCRYFSHPSIWLSSLLVEPRRPADAPISSGDGKPILQIWGLGTLSRSQTSIPILKPAQSWYNLLTLPPFLPTDSVPAALSIIMDFQSRISASTHLLFWRGTSLVIPHVLSPHFLKSYNTCHRPIHIYPHGISNSCSILYLIQLSACLYRSPKCHFLSWAALESVKFQLHRWNFLVSSGV